MPLINFSFFTSIACMDLAIISEHEALYREHLRLGSFAPNSIRIILSDIKYFIKWLNAHNSGTTLSLDQIDFVISKFSEHIRSDHNDMPNQKRRETAVLNYFNWLGDQLGTDIQRHGLRARDRLPEHTESNHMPDPNTLSLYDSLLMKKYMYLVLFLAFSFITLFLYLFSKSFDYSAYSRKSFVSDYFVVNFNTQIVKSYFMDSQEQVIVLKSSPDPGFAEIKSMCTFRFTVEDLLYSTLSVPFSSCSPKVDSFHGFLRIELNNVPIQDFEISGLAAVSISTDTLDRYKAIQSPVSDVSNTDSELLKSSFFDEIPLVSPSSTPSSL